MDGGEVQAGGGKGAGGPAAAGSSFGCSGACGGGGGEATPSAAAAAPEPAPAKPGASRASGRGKHKLPPVPVRLRVLTVSDTCSQGEAEDVSGPTGVAAVRELLEAPGVVALQDEPQVRVVADEKEDIAAAIRELAAAGGEDAAGLVLTSGGTGFTPRDVTPEATAGVLERRSDSLVLAVHAAMLPRLPACVLSRGIAGTLGYSLVINCPGKPKAVRETVEVLRGILPHALEQLRGSKRGHGADMDPRKARGGQ